MIQRSIQNKVIIPLSKHESKSLTKLNHLIEGQSVNTISSFTDLKVIVIPFSTILYL